jgi:hypothetical protein
MSATRRLSPSDSRWKCKHFTKSIMGTTTAKPQTNTHLSIQLRKIRHKHLPCLRLPACLSNHRVLHSSEFISVAATNNQYISACQNYAFYVRMNSASVLVFTPPEPPRTHQFLGIDMDAYWELLWSVVGGW